MNEQELICISLDGIQLWYDFDDDQFFLRGTDSMQTDLKTQSARKWLYAQNTLIADLAIAHHSEILWGSPQI